MPPDALVLAPRYEHYRLYLQLTGKTPKQARYIHHWERLCGVPDEVPVIIVNAERFWHEIRDRIGEMGMDILRRHPQKYVELDNLRKGVEIEKVVSV